MDVPPTRCHANVNNFCFCRIVNHIDRLFYKNNVCKYCSFLSTYYIINEYIFTKEDLFYRQLNASFWLPRIQLFKFLRKWGRILMKSADAENTGISSRSEWYSKAKISVVRGAVGGKTGKTAPLCYLWWSYLA